MDIMEILGKIGFDPKMALLNTINFLIVFLILKKFLFGNISKMVSERQQKIQEGLDNAEKMKHELASAEAKSDEVIKEAKKEANEIIKKTQEEAKQLTEKMKAETQKEIQGMYEKAKVQAEEEKRKMLEDLRTETAELAVLAAEQIVKQKLSKEEDKAMIKDFLANIKSK